MKSRLPIMLASEPKAQLLIMPKDILHVVYGEENKMQLMNIRKGPGTDYSKTGEYTGIGCFTIVQMKNGVGSDAGWGRLKSGAGWIALDFCEKI